MLKSPAPHNRRAAAEALGRIGDKKAVSHLLAAVAPLFVYLMLRQRSEIRAAP